jgi:hypothetical protein
MLRMILKIDGWDRERRLNWPFARRTQAEIWGIFSLGELNIGVLSALFMQPISVSLLKRIGFEE